MDFLFDVRKEFGKGRVKVDELSTFGVKGFILGTSALFKKEDSYSYLVGKLKNL